MRSSLDRAPMALSGNLTMPDGGGIHPISSLGQACVWPWAFILRKPGSPVNSLSSNCPPQGAHSIKGSNLHAETQTGPRIRTSRFDDETVCMAVRKPSSEAPALVRARAA